MKTVGLFFGSFNPVHTGHLIIAQYFVNTQRVDEVWLVVSPQNPLKPSSELAAEEHRLAMVHLAVSNNHAIGVCDLEFHLPRPSYTAHTLQHLVKKFPQYKFVILCGHDLLADFHRWRDVEYITSHFNFLVYPRPGAVEPVALPQNFKAEYFEAPLLGISATAIRSLCGQHKSVRYLVPDAVLAYMEEHALYR